MHLDIVQDSLQGEPVINDLRALLQHACRLSMDGRWAASAAQHEWYGWIWHANGAQGYVCRRVQEGKHTRCI